jgi:hypothetical protein
MQEFNWILGYRGMKMGQANLPSYGTALNRINIVK